MANIEIKQQPPGAFYIKVHDTDNVAIIVNDKMATRTELANRWYDLMDINAGTIATGEETIEQVGWKLFHFILDVASGRKKTFSDQWGLHNQLAVFNPAPVT